ncbi:ABC transporter ATP-binding protein [Bacillota bacterium Meth-B3]
MICVTNVFKYYGRMTVLDDVSATFDRGKIHGLIGRNGSGKTVLMKCITGLIRVTSGTISVDGQVVRKDIETLPSLGAIIETPGFLPYCSGYKNLALLAQLNKKADRNAVHAAIKTVGLDPHNRKWVSKYSMGMRQRLGIAQAIMEDPDLLILDEPMNGLDNAGVQDMRKLFLELKARGKTILLASHNREDIEALCDTVCEMDAGKLTRVR